MENKYNNKDSKLWINTQLNNINLCDNRLNKRALKIGCNLISNMGEKLTQSFPNNSELRGCYRFMNNERTNFSSIASSHWIETAKQCEGKKQILAIQDTTNLNYSNLTKTKGLSYITSEKSHGLHLHSVLACEVPLVGVGGVKLING